MQRFRVTFIASPISEVAKVEIVELDINYISELTLRKVVQAIDELGKYGEVGSIIDLIHIED